MTTPTPDPAPSRQFSIQLDIRAPRDAVWRAISEARELERWFAPRAEVEPGRGGQMVWEWRAEHRWPQTIEVWEPGRHLRTRYDSAVDDGQGGKQPLFVDFHLEGDGGVTTLRLVHSGFGPEASFDEEFDGVSHGWPVELRSLRHYLERHRGADRRLAWATAVANEAPQAAWDRLVGPLGLGAPALAAGREGAPFLVQVEGAGRIEGATLFAPTPREFSGVAANRGDGWFRASCERWGGTTQVWLWLATYGRDADETAAFQRGFAALLDRLFAPAGERT